MIDDEGEIVMVRRKRTVKTKTVTEITKKKPPPKVRVPIIKNIRFVIK